jgi:hypothetical protein
MSEWYFRTDDGKIGGPIPSSKLLELIRSGKILSETEVRKDDSPWVKACEVNGLWKAAGLPSIGFRCPFCQAAIDRPPTKCKNCERPIDKAVGNLRPNSVPADPGWTKFKRTEAKPKTPPLS